MRRKLIIFLIISSVLLVGCGNVTELFEEMVYKEPVVPVFEFGRNIDEVLSPEEMKEDLNQIKKDLLDIHPNTRRGFSKEMIEAFHKAEEKIKKPMDIAKFHFTIGEFITTLEDSHTNIIGNYDSDLSLPLDIKIVDDSFYVIDGKDLKPGDEIISIGGIEIEKIYKSCKKLISSENIYWINYNFSDFATLQSTLTPLDAEINDNEVHILINRDGENISIPLRFGDLNFNPIGDLEFKDSYITYPKDLAYKPQYSYYIDLEDNWCHFILKTFQDRPEYYYFLEMMFEDIKSKEIENLIIDLRGNTGGKIISINEFLEYIDIDRYVDPGYYFRYSQDSSDQYGLTKKSGETSVKPRLRTNKKNKDLLFSGDIYTLIDNGSFSAASQMGMILSDNNIGTIIGQPSGNGSITYGSSVGLQLPNSKLIYTISSFTPIRPEESKRDDKALYPDYEIDYTIEDYINKRDLTMEKALELIKANE